MQYYEATFFISAGISYFENWLDGFRLRHYPRLIELDKLHNISVIGAPTLKGEHRDTRIHEIEYSIAQLEASREIHSRKATGIYIFVTVLSADRIKVILRFNNEHFREDVLTMLEEITLNWPESIMGAGDLLATLQGQETKKHVTNQKQPKVENNPPKKKSRRGRPTQPKEEKIKAISDWENTDVPGKLEDFLAARFGTHSNGDPIVAKSTFYGWKQQLISSGDLPKN